jgi:hypothetical protein
MHLVQLRNVLRGLPDLAKGLCRIQYGKVRLQQLCAKCRAQRVTDSVRRRSLLRSFKLSRGSLSHSHLIRIWRK